MLIELSSYRDDEMSKVGINKYDKLKQYLYHDKTFGILI